jgi:histidine triad (HIT) family protein
MTENEKGIEGLYNQSNIFALILQGKEPCFRVYEDENALAFMDIFPESRGHTLVIPKNITARTIFDFPAAEFCPYMERVHRVAHAIKNSMNPDGISIIQYNGEAAGQSVFHLHFHIIPHYAGVPLAKHGTGRATKEELQMLANKIASCVRPHRP